MRGRYASVRPRSRSRTPSVAPSVAELAMEVESAVLKGRITVAGIPLATVAGTPLGGLRTRTLASPTTTQHPTAGNPQHTVLALPSRIRELQTQCRMQATVYLHMGATHLLRIMVRFSVMLLAAVAVMSLNTMPPPTALLTAANLNRDSAEAESLQVTAALGACRV